MQTAPLFLAKDARNENDDNVNVNVIEDIDPLTITAVGFSLIALNFFVFANLGEPFFVDGNRTLLSSESNTSIIFSLSCLVFSFSLL